MADHHPSFDEISKWKGIDIIYFQEDLRKKAKGNISEKSFYTYFKNSPVTKLPRIDMLNILSVYAGYVSWYDFKKNHLFTDEILKEYEDLQESEIAGLEKEVAESNISDAEPEKAEESIILSKKEPILTHENTVLQNSITENQTVDKKMKIYPLLTFRIKNLQSLL
ncbi:MAG: hypothetical protein ACXWB5_02320 [Kaistella sp.]